MTSSVASRSASIETGTVERGRPAGGLTGPPRPAAEPILSWEALPTGSLLARANGCTLVVRRGARGAFRFVLLSQLLGGKGVSRVASGRGSTAEQAMTAAERAVEALPDDAPRRATPPRAAPADRYG